MKVKDLIGPALDWAVAKAGEVPDRSINLATGKVWIYPGPMQPFQPSTDWAQAGFVIEREGISIIRADDDWGKDKRGYCNNVRIPVWCAISGQQGTTTSTEHQQHDEMFQIFESEVMYGPTALVAAMRCYVAKKLDRRFKGEIEIPQELL